MTLNVGFSMSLVWVRSGRLQAHHEEQLRQLPRELHAGRHEAREGQGHPRRGVRAHARRPRLLRLRGHEWPRELQGMLWRDRGQPLERRARRRRGQDAHEGFVQARLADFINVSIV